MGSTNFVDEMDCGSFFDHIDDLIDFPPENECAGGVGSGDCVNFPGIWNQPLPDSDPIFSAAAANSASDLSAELSVPYEDIVQLEWLSTFVEESFSGRGLTLAKENCLINPNPPPPYKSKTAAAANAAASPISVLESSSSSSSSSSYPRGMMTTMPLSPSQRGPHRARSKRPRPVAFNPPRPVMQLIETSLAAPGPEPPQEAEEKKKKKKIKFSMASSGATVPRLQKQEREEDEVVRKCMHCEITKTPQWRAGPMGPKTLCNACGVRYKSGRLFPEYRPAASPTFVASVHSNSHKKVVEMRSRASGITATPTAAPPATK
ncbi:hypothetical protein DM860_009249 [Cuscuta australis]|uniref:GATA transcription factor n=1 Tax=Cuscuta australis TaxID=267555 RepID=A0A328DA60_9ASTE|nr:hypothetical protein DM860_009249 [Cuscuta australis]